MGHHTQRRRKFARLRNPRIEVGILPRRTAGILIRISAIQIEFLFQNRIEPFLPVKHVGVFVHFHVAGTVTPLAVLIPGDFFAVELIARYRRDQRIVGVHAHTVTQIFPGLAKIFRGFGISADIRQNRGNFRTGAARRATAAAPLGRIHPVKRAVIANHQIAQPIGMKELQHFIGAIEIVVHGHGVIPHPGHPQAFPAQSHARIFRIGDMRQHLGNVGAQRKVHALAHRIAGAVGFHPVAGAAVHPDRTVFFRTAAANEMGGFGHINVENDRQKHAVVIKQRRIVFRPAADHVVGNRLQFRVAQTRRGTGVNP
ncbi:hypothetical protein SDC9_121305 [bioreactor metagenome]|uniref:Uncharacterized protein n=1 Tax=bioreactor metagenome TaxID=1076179 RepID=A0A645CBQ3_9ZZZZ